MSFWPRLRRRSRRRKRSSAAKSNPYATRDVDRFTVVHAELQAQRAQFASDKGVCVELVRFVSRSSRGWVYIPSESPSASTTPRPSQDGELTPSTSSLDVLQGFSLPPPALPLPEAAPEAAPSGQREAASVSSSSVTESASLGNGVMGLDAKLDSRRVGRLVVTRQLKDEAWMQISKTAAVLFVKVLVFSRALGASTAFAFTVAVVVDIWNRGKGTFHRVFSALATQLLTTLKPYLSLQQRRSSTTSIRVAPKLVPQPSAAQQISVSNVMKVSPISEDSEALEIGSSSFVFPLLSEDSSTSPRFSVHQRQDDSPQNASPTEPGSPLPSPLVESNKIPSAKPCQKLKAKLFKCSPARKGENSSPSTSELSNDVASSSGASSNSSPVRGKSSKKKASRVSKRPGTAEKDDDDAEHASSSLRPAKTSRSHELSLFRSPNNNRRKESTAQKDTVVVTAVSSTGVKDLSRSQELKLTLKALGKKKATRSQEFSSSSPPCPVQDLALPLSTVKGLESLAFPFRVEGQALQEERPSVPSSPRYHAPNRRRNSLSKLMTVEPPFEKHGSRGLDVGSSSPRASSSGGSVKGVKTTISSSSTSGSCGKTSAMLAAAELKPGLRKVRTTVTTGSEHDSRRGRTAVSNLLPTQSGEQGHSQALSREIRGSILVLGVLGFLLLGRIPAIFCTSCLCLILSQLQLIFQKRLTPRDTELVKRRPGGSRHNPATSSPARTSSGGSPTNYGSPAPEKSGLQSNEYRKRIVIEGLLDRGNRRGATS